MIDNRTRRRNQRQARRVIQNMTEAVESGNLERQRRIQQEGGNFMRDFYMRYVGPSGANSNSELRDFYMQRYTGSNSNSNSNSNRTRRVRSRSPSNSNRTRLAPSRRRSSAAPGRLIGSRTPSSPPGAPLRGRPRSRSSPSSSSRSSSSSSRGSNSNSNYSKWKVVKLNNPPKEDIALNNFNNKDAKAVKVSWTLNGKKYSDYYTPRTVTGLMYTFEGKPKPGEITNRKIQSAMQRLKSSSTDPNKVVFEHPGTRANVRRKNLEFVRLEKRTNKNKAATKIQAAFRGGRERQKTLNKAKRTAALITKKRRRN